MGGQRALGVLLALCVASPGCKKDDGDAVPLPAAPLGVGESGIRRLSRDEYDNTIRDLLFDDSEPADLYLPEDVIDPFDNDFTTQQPSAVLVSGFEALANDVATRLVADQSRLDLVLGCAPAGPSDAVCLESFVRHLGRLAWRRPLADAEVDGLVALGLVFSSDSGNFEDAADVVVRAMLQYPEFVYRIELGVPTQTPGVFRLSDYEVATRLSFLLWGSTPDDWLLDEVEAGSMATPQGVRDIAAVMLDEPRARDRMDRFHAMWMGYWSLPHPVELVEGMRAETRTLVEDVVFERDTSWLELFTADGTFVDDDMADHYGLPQPGSDTPTWVDYGDSGRQGILSHGSFLSVNAKFGDTSPTLRGKLVRERLLCQIIPPPPPTVNVDEPPAGDGNSDCKIDRYEQHRSDGSCRSCHEQVDPIGFGLENFDREGIHRDHDIGEPSCVIDGEGDVDGEAFVGPSGLADLLVDGPLLSACAVDQTYRFAMGHSVGTQDEPYAARLALSFPAGGYGLQALLLELVGDDAFLHRRDEEVTP